MSAKLMRNDATKQDENLSKLVMSAFYKIAMAKNGATSDDIVRFLREKFGDVWRTGALVNKAEQTLSHSASLGFLDHRGKRYAVPARSTCCRRSRRRKRKRCGCVKRRRRLSSCRKKRRRRSRCRRRRCS